jgi:hypothetical protein
MAKIAATKTYDLTDLTQDQMVVLQAALTRYNNYLDHGSTDERDVRDLLDIVNDGLDL